MDLLRADAEQISAAILEVMQQKAPFRFLDRIIEIDGERCIGQVTFDPASWFYRGHFPGNPITPGVILVEAMAQTGVVAFGIYLHWLSGGEVQFPDFPNTLTLFSDVTAQFNKVIHPGSVVTIKAEKRAFRRRKLISEVLLLNERGEVAAAATLSGIGVEQHA